MSKIEFKLRQRAKMKKTQPSVSDVHAPTALGNQGRARAKDFLTVLGELPGGAKIVQLPTAAALNVVDTAKKDGLTTVFFMRHGATRFNNQTDMSQDRVRSWNDVPLTEEGREDAAKAGKKLDKEGIKVIVSSSLGRARETARIVKKTIGDKDIELISTPKMLPWNLGDFTGQTTDKAHDGIKYYIEHPDEVVPNGESFNDFRTRAAAGMAWAMKKAGRRKLLVISHHRNERLWTTSGHPPRLDATIDAEKFLKPGEDPGDVTTFEFDPRQLKGKAGATVVEPVGKLWGSNAELPDSIKNSLPDEAQSVFRRVANDRFDHGASEQSAIRQAWTAVKNGWKKQGDEWVRKLTDDPNRPAGGLDPLGDKQTAGVTGNPDENNASLMLLPIDDNSGWAKTPFPWDHNALSRLKPEQVKPFLGALTNQDQLPVRLFHMKTLVAVQDRVNPEKVQAMIEDEPDTIPLVVRIGGRNVIADGHHRATARYLMGRKTMQAHFMDLDNPVADAQEDDGTVKVPDSGAKKRWQSFDRIIKWRPSFMRAKGDTAIEVVHSHPDEGFSRAFEVKKIDEDQQLVFGWASISSVGGQLIVDKQDDVIPEDELEKAAYDYVLYHRRQGDMHERMGVGRCVESMMFSKQKQDALGIDLGLVGWWIGFKVDDGDVWKRIKSGDLPEFSIGGKGTRETI